MTSRTAAEAFAAATSALVDHIDPAGILANLLSDCVGVLGADSAGLLVRTSRNHGLELLSSTSHRAAELELFQLQHATGPGLDAMNSMLPHGASAETRLSERWPPVGAAIAAAGYQTVHAYPVRFRGTCLGALNTFYRCVVDESPDPRGQTFADIATLVVTQQIEMSESVITARVEEAIRGRIVIEQAKGVIAYRENMQTGEAYARLRSLAGRWGVTLTQAAERVSDAAQQGGPGEVHGPPE